MNWIAFVLAGTAAQAINSGDNAVALALVAGALAVMYLRRRLVRGERGRRRA